LTACWETKNSRVSSPGFNLSTRSAFAYSGAMGAPKEPAPGFTTAFNIYDDDDQLALIKGIYRHLGLDEKFMQYRAVLSRISHAKSHEQTPEDMQRAATDPKTGRIAVAYEQYEGRLRQANALDFDDLLLEASACCTTTRGPGPLQPALRAAHDRRVSGYESKPVSTHAVDVHSAEECLRSWRRGSVDLRLAGRRHPEHSRV